MQQKPGDFTRAVFIVIEVQEVLVLIGWLKCFGGFGVLC